MSDPREDSAAARGRRGRLGLRLRHKLGASLVVVAVIPVLVAYWVSSSVVIRGLERGIKDETERQLRVGLNLLLRNIEGLGHEATRLSESVELVSALQEKGPELEQTVRRQAQRMPSALVQVADDTGAIVFEQVVGGEKGRFEGLWVSSSSPAVQAGLTYERRVTVVEADGILVVRATAPVVDERFHLRGVVVVSVPLDGLFADGIKASLGADVMIFAGKTGDGKPELSFLDPSGARVVEMQLSPLVRRSVSEGHSSYANIEVLKRPYAMGYAPVYEIEGNIVGVFAVAVDRQPLLLARDGAYRSLGLGALGAFVFALGLAGLLSRRITRPLHRLHVGASAIAKGDLDHEIKVPEGDEIGDLASAFGEMTSALKENQRRLAARMREIVALHDAGRAVSSVIELDQVLRKVVDSVVRVLHVRICALWLVRTGEGDDGLIELDLGAARAKRPDMRNISDWDEIEELVMPLSSIAMHVARTRHSLHFDDITEVEHFAGAAEAAGIDGSLVAAVLERKGGAVGVIVIGRGASSRPFSEADANLLSTFADQAATAIENASLYAEVRQFNEELEAKVALRTNELQAINFELGKTISELRETQAQLTLSERLAGLGQLVAGVAHEINSPSAAIRGTVDSLGETMKRLIGKQGQIAAAGFDDESARALTAFCQRVAPELASRRRIAPAVVRREGRALRSLFVERGVSESTAQMVARPLVELGVDGDLATELLPFLQQDREEGRFTLDYLKDYVYLHRSTRTIQDAIRRIQRIVGSLKGYSHLDQNAARVEADIHEGIENTLVILDHQMTRGITVKRNYAALPGVPVFVDELNQVWTNLIHNAIQAIDGEGQIDIETAVDGDGVRVRIIDSGPGIPDEVKMRIFEPFFTTKPKGEGTGLGLGIVNQIVDKHQGRVSCESEPGRTCFEVWLPLSEGNDNVDEALSEAAMSGQMPRQKEPS